MKKFYLIISVLLIVAINANAQPTLTFQSNAPEIGDVYYQSYSQDQLLPGPQGPNKTWDFSDINVFETGEILAIDPASTPFADIFTGANIAFNYNGTATYNYSEMNQNEGFNWGTGFDDTPQMIIFYDDPAKLIVYPCSYQDEFTDMYHGEYEYQQLLTQTTGFLTKTADAWGTITTPAGTFENVLRLKTIRDHIDSIWMGDIFISKTVITYKDYEWYTSDSKVPVFAITITNSVLVNDTVSYFLTGATSLPEFQKQITYLSISPNPAREHINFSYLSEDLGRINISITDMTGKEIMNWEISKSAKSIHNYRLDIAGIQPGMYFLRVVQGKQSTAAKLFVN